MADTPLLVACLREQAPEQRVALTPDTTKRFVALGAAVALEKGAGVSAGFPDNAYIAAGARIALRSELLGTADLFVQVARPAGDDIKLMKKNAVLLAVLDPFGNEKTLDFIALSGISAFAMDMMPRITRAQNMDVLSSQANLAGYRAVIEASAAFGRAFPMMMTAAGTVPAAKVFVMGAGVAGLQAIATARRLGAVVTATDVRAAAKEQVASLGAKFIAVENDEFKAAETATGYAKPMSEAYQALQAELVTAHIAKQDVVITTALIPGRAAPLLVSKGMVEAMQPGAIIVDLAVERGGNVAGAKASETIDVNGVKIIGLGNGAGALAQTASLLYARNLFNFAETLIDKDSKALKPDMEDELVKATLLTYQGKIVHSQFTAKVKSA